MLATINIYLSLFYPHRVHWIRFYLFQVISILIILYVHIKTYEDQFCHVVGVSLSEGLCQVLCPMFRPMPLTIAFKELCVTCQCQLVARVKAYYQHKVGDGIFFQLPAWYIVQLLKLYHFFGRGTIFPCRSITTVICNPRNSLAFCTNIAR